MGQHRKSPAKRSSKTNHPKEDPKEDPVVSELGIFVLPVHKTTHKSSSINRLQFQQTRYQLRSRVGASLDINDVSPPNYSITFKQRVKHLKIFFQIQKGYRFWSRGRSCHSAKRFVAKRRIGCLKNGKLFLLPTDKTYEMKRVMCSNISDQFLDSQLENGPLSTFSAITPIRVRFARLETDLQKHRRENSALFKQREVDADTWLPLAASPTEVPELYAKEISQIDGQLHSNSPEQY
uniref:Uncharacterized protein n=1 Tax=Ditylenchus dipsaci TaxID=166011 RepID=A0A915D953_9BILA